MTLSYSRFLILADQSYSAGCIGDPAKDIHLPDTAAQYHQYKKEDEPNILLFIQQLWYQQVIGDIDHQGQVEYLDGGHQKSGGGS